jgi:hypothetical protein
MARVSGARFANEFAAFLGVDIEGQYVYRIEAVCDVNEAVTVIVHRFADVPDGTTVATKYFLTDAGEPPVVTPPPGVGPIDEITSFKHDTKTYRKRAG